MSKLAALILALSVLASCAASIPCPEDYGMSREQMANSWSVAYVVPRGPRVRTEQLASNLYLVELPQFGSVAVEQEGRDYCWAAALEMVLRYNSIDADQHEIVDSIKGATREDGDDAGSVFDIAEGLWGPFRSTFISNGISNWICADLLFDSPVIMGIRPPDDDDVGHILVVTGMTFSLGPNGEVIAHDLLCCDPSDGQLADIDACDIREEIVFAAHFRNYQRPF